MNPEGRINITQCTFVTAVTSALLFAMCWAGAYFGIASDSHLFIALFTLAAPVTALALATGVCSALLFGGLAGAIFAILFNSTRGWFAR